MSHDAFISYSSLDKAAADATCTALEASGIRCWIAPRDITPGMEWGDAIIDAINRSRVMILIFSAHANDSPQIRREVERAVSKGIPIIPLRIQNIAPTHSLEYFIGTVHWLDALTPPLESHLRRLAESVKMLLQIDPPMPRIVAPETASGRRVPAMAAVACLGLALAAGSVWWLTGAKAPQPPATPHPPITPPPAAQNPPPVAKPPVDPRVVGTFVHDGVADDYDWHFVYSIAGDGTYRLVMTKEESGTFQGGNGVYRTLATKTGRVRTGTYRAVGSDAIEVTNAEGTAIFRPAMPIAPLDKANPVMLGTWRATLVQDGLTWNLTAQNNPDATYRDVATAEDNGHCTFADGKWRATSSVSGRSASGSYRVLDPRDIEITIGKDSTVWQRQ